MKKKDHRAENLLDWLGIRDAPDWRIARLLGRFVAFILTLLILISLVAAGAVLIRTIFKGEGSLGAGALIVAVLSAPFLVWNTIIRQTTLNFQKEGHLTDRLAKAVEQLGAQKTVKKDDKEATEPNLEVRIGGLLSLERIAQDSTAYDKGRDHVRVMEIICAYIRNNAPAKDATNFPPGDLEPSPDDATSELRKERADKLRAWAQTLEGPREDIMLALTILERRSDQQRQFEAAHGQQDVTKADWVFAEKVSELQEAPEDKDHPEGAVAEFKTKLWVWKEKLNSYQGYRPDLRFTCLQGADLYRFHLSGVRLDRARLEGAVLNEARLEGAALIEARMEGALISGARMEGADLSEARMEAADLSKAIMLGASASGAQMDGAIMEASQMQAATLVNAKLRSAHIWNARMEGADLHKAHLEGADLSGARMDRADLSYSHLQGAILTDVWMNTETSLYRTDFSGVALKSVDYGTIRISQDQVNASFGDASVILPEGLDRPAHWPDWELDRFQFDDEWRSWRKNPEAYALPPRPAD